MTGTYTFGATSYERYNNGGSSLLNDWTNTGAWYEEIPGKRYESGDEEFYHFKHKKSK